MQPEQAEIKRWLLKARHDWSAAMKILTPDSDEMDVVAFHFQQAVEKTLKAYLVSRAIDFEKAHDLGRLLDHCIACDERFDLLRDRVEPLTQFAVAFRYPGPADPSPEEVESARRVVEQVWAFVTQRLPEGCLP
jgi:HEPN domain-containing protein